MLASAPALHNSATRETAYFLTSRWPGVDCKMIQEQERTNGQAEAAIMSTESIAATGSAYFTLRV